MNKAVKILHVIGGGEFGGAEQHILSLMKQYNDHGIDATVVTFYDAIFAQKLREAGHSVIALQQYGRFDLRILTALIRLLNEMKPDLIHTHGVRANFYVRLAAKQTSVRRIVTTVHSILRLDYPKTIPYIIAYLMERTTQSLTSHFIAVSDGIKEQLLATGIKEPKITVVQNGIDATLYASTPEIEAKANELRQEWNIANDVFVIGTNARLVPVKGLNHLIEGMKVALNQDSSLHLLIAGDGPDRDKLQQLIHQNKINDKVSLVGFRNDVANCLAVMDVYINCSLSEGTPISVMEAMAAEKPLILTAVGGMKEMAQHDESALMIPPQSAEAIAASILRLKRDPVLRERIALAARRTVEERYSVQAMTRKQIEIYTNLLNIPQVSPGVHQ